MPGGTGLLSTQGTGVLRTGQRGHPLFAGIQTGNTLSGTVGGWIESDPPRAECQIAWQTTAKFTRRERAVTTYRVSTSTGSGRTMLIEHPKRDGWTLVDPDSSTTPTAHRITRDVGPGSTEAIRVVQERPRGERVVLGDTPTVRLVALATEGTLSPALRAGLTRIAALRADLDRKNDGQRVLRERRAAILADQDRLRSNLGPVPSNSELQRRYLGQMQAQETELDRLGVQEAAASRAVNEADTALKDAVAGVQD